MWSSDLPPGDIEEEEDPVTFTWLPPWLLVENLGEVMAVENLGPENHLIATIFPSVVLFGC